MDRISPIGPHNHAQKIAAITTEIGDRPDVSPNTSGSRNCPITASVATNNATVCSAMPQPGSTAAANKAGSNPAITDPIYGTKRNSAPSVPHSNGLGTPISSIPNPTITPNSAFIPSRLSRYRLSRCAVSSSALVVRCRSLRPNSRMKRSRRSACCNRMKIVTMNTMPVVAS